MDAAILDRMEEEDEVKSKPIANPDADGLPSAISGYHLLKWLPWDDDTFIPIITQNENGPCPLLALCNVLLLQNMIKLPKGETIVTTQHLLDLLGSCLLNCRPKVLTVSDQSNYEQNMQDAIAVFPRLLTGLDVNVKFGSVSGFEFTQELSIFDLLSVPLYHGWLADPSDHVTYPIVSSFSYNQLVEFTINNLTSEDAKRQHEALAAQEFLSNTASQLTYHGLCELNRVVSEGEFCVFFRNNHFNTLFKKDGRLLILVTDFGFLNELGHVWHILSDIDDSGDFLDANFTFIGPQMEEEAEVINKPDTVITKHHTPDPELNDLNDLSRSSPKIEPRNINNLTTTPTVATPIAATPNTNEEERTHDDRLDYQMAAKLQAQERQSMEDLQSDADLALHLQEQEMLHQQHTPPPSSSTDHHHRVQTHEVPTLHSTIDPSPLPMDGQPPLGQPPPNTREEYEAAAAAMRRHSDKQTNPSVKGFF